MQNKDNSNLMKSAIRTIDALKMKIKKLEEIESIAVIGMACRFPGGCDTPEKFWDFLKDNKNGIVDAPANRWNIKDYLSDYPNFFDEMYTVQGGYLQEDIGEFDAKFFQISPREAIEMDPQQRLLLEVAWEAIERSGQNPDKLKGSETGVFIGIISNEYAWIPKNPLEMDKYAITGTPPSTASGRLAYTFGFYGPAISVDTACSSSLVGVHLACESLRRKECDMALAGGVNLILSPLPTLGLCKMGALSIDGKCKTFDESANGYVRSEGCGIVVLKRLTKAVEDKDNILAVIPGSAMNHNGNNGGLTVPSGISQKKLLKKALNNAKIEPENLNYLEAHGTGTDLGDPIETQAINDVFVENGNRKDPLIIGAVKSNIGHLEGAAGIAGLIKTLLCLQNNAIPSNLHFNKLNQKINFDKKLVIIPNKLIKWDKNEKPRIAGVSSFGFSGTNVHLIVKEAPPVPVMPKNFERPFHILTVSATNPKALDELIKKYYEYLEKSPDIDVGNLCYTSNACRASFSYRAAFIGGNLYAIRNELTGYLHKEDNEKSKTVYQGRVESATKPKIAFIINSHIEHLHKTGADLLATQPTFYREMEKCDSLFKSYINVSILEYLNKSDCEDEKSDKKIIKAAIVFSLKYSLAKLWISWGVKPSAVMGEGIGLFVAACVADVMQLETAVKCVSKVGSILISRSDVESKTFNKEELSTLNEIEELSKNDKPAIKFISSSSGKPASLEGSFGKSFWINELSSPVQLKNGIETLHEQGFHVFMEIGFQAGNQTFCENILSGEAKTCLPNLQIKNSWETLINSAARLYCLGGNVNWDSFDKDYHREKIVLPTYSFQRKRYWYGPSFKKENHRDGNLSIDIQPDLEVSIEDKNDFINNPLHGKFILTPLKNEILEYHLSVNNLPEVADNHNVLHVGYYQEMLCDMMRELYNTNSYTITSIRFMLLLLVSEISSIKLHLVVEENSKEEIKFKFFSWDKDKSTWNLHVEGSIKLNNNQIPIITDRVSFENLRNKLKNRYTGFEFYQMMQKRGYDLGTSVKLIDEVWYKEGEALARLRNPGNEQNGLNYKIGFHPGILDACAQLYAPAFPRHVNEKSMFMMVKWEKFTCCFDKQDHELWGYVRLNDNNLNPSMINGTFYLFDNKGKVIAECMDAQMVELTDERLGAFTNSVLNNGNANKINEDLIRTDLVEKLKTGEEEDSYKALAQYLTETLGFILKISPGEIDENESFQIYGMDSLVGIELSKKISSELGMDINFQLIVSSDNIKVLSKNILDALLTVDKEDVGKKTKINKYTDDTRKNMEETIERIKRDAILNPDIIIAKNVELYNPSKKVKNILLTGATGYLGVFVLKQLLDTTDATIYCTVRAQSVELGWERIKNNLLKYDLWEKESCNRIIPVISDIGKERLGLQVDMYEKMKKEIDAIYHTAANTNHVLAYESLKHVDAFSTLELIKIAFSVKVKPIYFVSTFGVNIRAREDYMEFLHNEYVTGDISGFSFTSGYWAGKWVSEQLLDQANKRGLPMMIFRVGEMTGHSKTGISRTDDMFITLLKLFYSVKTRTAYEDAIIDMVPVDFISQAIVYLSKKVENIGDVFFLTNPNPSKFNDLFDVIEKTNKKPLKKVTFNQWVMDCKNNIDNTNDKSLADVLHQYFTEDVSFGGLKYRFMFYFLNFHINNEKAIKALEGSNIKCPPVNNELLECYINYFIECGYFNDGIKEIV